jgi:hypothetical protein
MYERWMNKVKIGSVLRSRSGLLRVVRDLRRRGDRLHSVSFTIKHCSWTHRCTTTLTYNDLSYMGFRPTGKRRRLRTELDRMIALDCLPGHPGPLDCCDVTGIS